MVEYKEITFKQWEQMNSTKDPVRYRYLCFSDEYGRKSWIFDSKYHRTDGPAIICPDGSKFWYINGALCHSNKQFQSRARLTDEDMLAIIIKYGNVEFRPYIS